MLRATNTGATAIIDAQGVVTRRLASGVKGVLLGEVKGDYDPLPRINGHSNFGLRGSFALAFTGMLAFSIAPLRILTMTGVLLASLALGYGAWVIAEYFLWGIDVPGYATLVVGMMFFSGIQLLSIGVLAEYVGRIYEEVKQRPLYVVSQRWGKGL